MKCSFLHTNMHGLYDIYTTQSAIRALPNVRAANKNLWILWITNEGQFKHTEYILTVDDVYYPEGVPQREIIDGSRVMMWGRIWLCKSHSADQTYQAGFKHCPATYSISVIPLLTHSQGGVQFARHSFTKYDTEHGLSTKVSCIYPIHFQINDILAMCKDFTLNIITATRIYDFSIQLPRHRFSVDSRLYITIVRPTRTLCERIVDPAPILDLLEFAKSTSLDIVGNLPPLEIYDKLLANIEAPH